MPERPRHAQVGGQVDGACQHGAHTELGRGVPQVDVWVRAWRHTAAGLTARLLLAYCSATPRQPTQCSASSCVPPAPQPDLALPPPAPARRPPPSTPTRPPGAGGGAGAMDERRARLAPRPGPEHGRRSACYSLRRLCSPVPPCDVPRRLRPSPCMSPSTCTTSRSGPTLGASPAL